VTTRKLFCFTFAIAVSVAATACTDGRVSEPLGVAPREAIATAQDPLSRGVALALARREFRERLIVDMRGSRLARHALVLGEYLQTPHGKLLAHEIGSALGQSTEEVIAGLSSRSPLQLVMARPLDRARWEGEASVLVTRWEGLQPGADTLILSGFGTDGRLTRFRADEAIQPPLLMIEPAGGEPSLLRAASSGPADAALKTISTREEEQAAARANGPRKLVSCDDDPESCYGNGGGGGGTSVGYQWSYGFSYTSCTLYRGVDVDQDGIDDACEEKLAQAFRPFLQMSLTDFDPSRESYFVVRKSTTNSVDIMYLLGYHNDKDHVGDSEFIVLRVTDVGRATWQLTEATLSAHWNTPVDRTRTVGYQLLAYPEHYGQRPLIWVAESKHANYHSQSECNGSVFWVDDCSRLSSRQEVVFPAGSNLGYSSHQMLNCMQSRYWPSYPGTECFWTDTTFRGWYAGVPGVTPYRDLLWNYGFGLVY
jgi:hypothetical protein